jgi:hypothetical protein
MQQNPAKHRFQEQRLNWANICEYCLVICSFCWCQKSQSSKMKPPASSIIFNYCPEDKGSMHLQNNGNHLPEYTVSHPRKLQSSYSLHLSNNTTT